MPDYTQETTALRKQLLSNGYTPLPLDGKACYIPGWTTAEIDEAWLEPYRRSARYKNTGLRCGRLVGVDIDCDDVEVADALDVLASDILGISDLVRYGQGEKRLIVYRLAEPIRKRRTTKYLDEQTGVSYQVEILSRGSQFAAYGRHPSGIAYEWVEAEPATTDIQDISVTTEAKLDEYVEAAEQYLEGLGLPASSQAGGSVDADGDYCLTPDDVFEITQPRLGQMTVAAIKQEIGAATWQCNLTAIRPDSDSEAGRISLCEVGLRVTDFVEMVTYYERTDVDADGLADALPEPPPDGGSMFGPTGGDTLADLLEHWAYVAADDTFRLIGDPTRGIKAPAFSKMKRGKAPSALSGTMVTVTNAFLDNPQATKCTYTALRPDYPDNPVIIDGGHRYLNTYRRPLHALTGGESATFDEFMRHLIPRRAERELCLDWIATKLQNPAIRMHGLVMVAPNTYGTGRGTFYKILAALMGEHYVTKTTLAHLTGATTQSQYNDYLSNSLLVYIAEARDGASDEGKATYYTRKHANEQIKSVVETDAERELIVRKGVANVTEKIFSSILISTNHADALAIEDGDRRLMMVSNGKPITPDLADRVNAWRRNPANVAQVYGELMLRAAQYSPHGVPPMTPAKRFMLDASRSGIDEAWQMFFDSAAGDVCTMQQWKSYAHQMRAQHALEFPDVNKIDRALERKLNDHSAVWKHDKKAQVKIKGKPYRPYILRNPERWQDEVENPSAVSAEIQKNGEPDTVLLSLPERQAPE